MRIAAGDGARRRRTSRFQPVYVGDVAAVLRQGARRSTPRSASATRCAARRSTRCASSSATSARSPGTPRPIVPLGAALSPLQALALEHAARQADEPRQPRVDAAGQRLRLRRSPRVFGVDARRRSRRSRRATSRPTRRRPLRRLPRPQWALAAPRDEAAERLQDSLPLRTRERMTRAASRAREDLPRRRIGARRAARPAGRRPRLGRRRRDARDAAGVGLPAGRPRLPGVPAPGDARGVRARAHRAQARPRLPRLRVLRLARRHARGRPRAARPHDQRDGARRRTAR